MVMLYLGLKQWKKKTAVKIGDKFLVDQLVKGYSSSKFALKFWLFIVAFAVAVFALANPRLPMGSANVNRSGIDVVIALDVSKSMLATDVQPDRLERAKQVVARLIDKLSDDRIGIVVFAGRAYLQMPLTTDHSAAKMYLGSATPAVVPTQGTVISDALKMSFAAFNTKEKKYKSIILISDGEDHDETALTYSKALSEEGVMINTIGIGSPEGTFLKDPETNDFKKDVAGNPVITKLNEEELKVIAANSNGVYHRFTNTEEAVNAMYNQLQTLGQRPITENSMMNYKNYYPWLLGLSLLFLVIEFFFSEKRHIVSKKKVALPKNSFAAVVVLLLFPLLVGAQKDNELVKKGNETYDQKLYDEAAKNYKEALTKNPGNLPAQYNLGNALYRGQKTEDALAAYDASIASSKMPLEKSGTFYNKGVVLQNAKKLPECIEAYKQALRLNPTDEDARLNLQKALLQQKKEEQQKDKENDDKKKPNDDKKQQDKQQQKEDQQKDQQPKPQRSKMTKKEAEEKLKALLQQEKKLQEKLRKVGAASATKPDKDW